MDTITTTTTASLTLDVAKSIASLAVFAEPAKGTTPALQVIELNFTEDSVIAVATDRYTAAKAVFAYPGDAIGRVYLDHAGAKFISGLVASPGMMVEFTPEENGQLAIAYQQFGDYQARHYSPRYLAKFPGIESMIDGHKAGTMATTAFTIELLAKLGKVVGLNGKKIGVWTFTPGETDRPDRPAPILATKDEFSVLIQPNLTR
jgi:hypothetical protein